MASARASSPPAYGNGSEGVDGGVPTDPPPPYPGSSNAQPSLIEPPRLNRSSRENQTQTSNHAQQHIQHGHFERREFTTTTIRVTREQNEHIDISTGSNHTQKKNTERTPLLGRPQTLAEDRTQRPVPGQLSPTQWERSYCSTSAVPEAEPEHPCPRPRTGRGSWFQELERYDSYDMCRRRGDQRLCKALKPLIIWLILSAFTLLFMFVLFRSFMSFDIGFPFPVHQTPPPLPPNVVKVGIVGAGPAGISASYIISQFPFSKKKGIADTKLELTVFESKPQVGGRLVLSSPSLTSFSTSHPNFKFSAQDISPSCLLQNAVFVSRVKKVLGQEIGLGDLKSMVGFYAGDGENGGFVAELSRPRSETSWGRYIKLLWRYSSDVWKATILPTGTVRTFNAFLKSQSQPSSSSSQVTTYASIWEMVVTGGLAENVGMSAKDRLAKNGIDINGKYLHEVLQPQLRRQSGLDISEVSDLSLSIALSREGAASCLSASTMSFEDTLSKFADRSKAELRLSTTVDSFRRVKAEDAGDEKWLIEYHSSNSDSHKKRYEAFDHLIIAAPWNTSSFLPPDVEEIQEQVVYKPLWVTLLSTIRPPNIGSSGALPAEILPVEKGSLGESRISEIVHLRDIYHVDEDHQVSNRSIYRILSSEPITRPILDRMWIDKFDVVLEEEILNAYPIQIPRTSGEEIGNFEVVEGQGLWHSGSLEAAATGVDLAWVVGENVGRLVGRRIESNRKRE
ncbi:hypothetical protein BGZ60DRAFT_526603 [Tricladium varicosporioides]|nr:hypothetical protein BGZ60DRAFT_526603 [Hymenoscyphus varicosporioides]